MYQDHYADCFDREYEPCDFAGSGILLDLEALCMLFISNKAYMLRFL